MNASNDQFRQHDLFDDVVHARLRPGAAVGAGLDRGLAALGATRQAKPPRPDFVLSLKGRLSTARVQSAAGDGGSERPVVGRRMRPFASAVAALVLLMIAVGAGWTAKGALSEDKPPSGVARPVEFPTLGEAQAAVVFPIVRPAGAAQPDSIRWYCMKFQDRPCSPLAAWIQAEFQDVAGRGYRLQQGYFGVIAFGRVADEFVPTDRKGTFEVNGLTAYWIDCRGDDGARACSSASVEASDEFPMAPGENIAARSRLAAVGWMAGSVNGSQRWIGLESSSLSPEELRAIAASLAPLAP